MAKKENSWLASAGDDRLQFCFQTTSLFGNCSLSTENLPAYLDWQARTLTETWVWILSLLNYSLEENLLLDYRK